MLTMTATKDGNVVLYHDTVGRLSTDSTCITVTNRITGANGTSVDIINDDLYNKSIIMSFYYVFLE